ncbi:hypothetical protein VTI74DRAFT_3010 [Chaetomium olivicolor]
MPARIRTAGATTTTREELEKEFATITETTREIAQRYLRNNQYDVQAAVNQYFSPHHGQTGAPKKKDGSSVSPDVALSAVFDSIEPKANNDELDIDGFVAYCELLGVDITTYESFVLAEVVQVPSFGQVTRQGFIRGWKELGAEWSGEVSNNVDLQKQLVRSCIDQVRRDPDYFRKVYRSTFTASKEAGKREIDMETALSSWDTMFALNMNRWKSAHVDFLEAWKEYVTEKFWIEDKAAAKAPETAELGEEQGEEENAQEPVKKHGKWMRSVSRDLWNQMLPFATKSLQDETLGFWSEEQAWPGVIDEFVVWCKEKGIASTRNGDRMEVE